ncbi:ATP phosphoribosyltransferase regulatory subunit [Paracoccaceae bacterium GXU_MW_L88]
MSQTRAEALGGQILAQFEAAGAARVAPEALQPADLLLDLYGEDIRARAFVTHDPVDGELMLRPDFTVPVVQSHMAHGAEAGRYCYLGPVWRRQDLRSTRPRETLQVGIEMLGDADSPSADAALFALLSEVLGRAPLTPIIGDMGILLAAIDGLDAGDALKAALRRHLWRPARFRRLLERFSKPEQISETRQALFDALEAGTLYGALSRHRAVGLRSAEDIAARVRLLKEETERPRLPARQVAILGELLSLAGPVSEVMARLRELAEEMHALAPAVDRAEDRNAALEAAGVETQSLRFELSFGRTTLEYYDGFVFGFLADDPALAPIASGGRYDALTGFLGDPPIPALGAIIRPETLAEVLP